MGNLDQHHRTPPAEWLQAALAVTREDDASRLPPARLREQVMRAWDSQSRHRGTSRRRTFWLAGAATLGFAITWASDQGRHRTEAGGSVNEGATVVSVDRDAYLDSGIAMDEPSSIQYVRLRLAPKALAAFGMPMANPADDQPVAVEALIGLDGIPRAIRYARSGQESP